MLLPIKCTDHEQLIDSYEKILRFIFLLKSLFVSGRSSPLLKKDIAYVLREKQIRMQIHFLSSTSRTRKPTNWVHNP